MGKRQEALRAFLDEPKPQRKLACVRLAEIQQSLYASDVIAIFEKLGGKTRNFSFRHGGWDATWLGIPVELDEELHFNKYRAITLDSKLYDAILGFPITEYRAYSKLHAAECLRAGSYGNRWTSIGSERQFGHAAPRGKIAGAGAPRWKQRALYDFIKDAGPLMGGPLVARIAVWDVLDDISGGRTVGEALQRPSSKTKASLRKLIRRRIPRLSTEHGELCR